MLKTVLTFKEKIKQSIESNTGQVISFGISDNYVPGWGEVEALREYVANAYDENGTDFTIEHTENGILLEDESERGIHLQDLVIGNSNSREFTYKIGTHGEGFKIGALAMARLGKDVYIETIGNTIVFFLEYDEELKSNILKAKVEPNERTKGSTIYLETDKLEELKSMFLFLNEDLLKVNDMLYINTQNMNNQIFVNTLAGQQIYSYFSYSLRKKQKINRDRNLIDSPYHDIALELLSCTDKEVLKTWLKSLARPEFQHTFEYEILSYVSKSLHRKDFKNLDFTLIRECAKEIQLEAILHSSKSAEQEAFRFVHPEKNLIFLTDNNVYTFFEKVLQNLCSSNFLNYAIQLDGLYHIPVSTWQTSTILSEALTNLQRDLRSSAILKSVEFDGNALYFNLKDLHKVDMILGKTSKRNYSIQYVMNQLAVLADSTELEIQGWHVSTNHYNPFPTLIAAELPKQFNIVIHDLETVIDLQNNISLMNATKVIPHLVYRIKKGPQYAIDGNDQLGEVIQANFSYKTLDIYDRTKVLSNSTVLKTLFKIAKNGKLSNFPFEENLFEKVTYDLEVGYVTSWSKKDLKKAVEKEFKSVFGAKVVVPTDDQSDKKARYNGYTLLTECKVVANFLKELGIALSSSVRGSDTQGKNIIDKPTALTWKEYADSPYLKLIHSVATLQKTLENAYELIVPNDSRDAIMNGTDKRYSFIQNLLPYSAENDLKKLNLHHTNYLNKTNYKRIIREYCYMIYDRSSLVKSFDSNNTKGLHTNGSIFLKNNPVILGTFFHEYIHFATDLKDIDTEFEKALAFMSIVGNKFKNSTDEELKSWLKEYKKWAGGK